MKECDMKDSELCQYYQMRLSKGQRCNYGFSHGVENCPFDSSKQSKNLELSGEEAKRFIEIDERPVTQDEIDATLRGLDALCKIMKKLDVMDKAIIKNWYKEKILSDFIDVERGKLTYTKFIENLKENLTNLCDEIQGFPILVDGEE